MITNCNVLYWGDNGKHEFWEDQDHQFLILRVHGETCWSAHRQHGFLFFCRSETEAATRLKLVLSRTRKWVKNADKFVLEPAIETTQS